MKSLLLIDLSGIFWRCWHATADSEVSAAYEQTVAKVHELRHGYDYVAVCCDSPPYKRKELLPTYKANREAAPPLALDQFRRTKERLAADGLLLWEAPGFEADDVIAWACWMANDAASPRAIPASVTVASADKDLMVLVRDSSEFPVTQLHPFDGKRYDRAAVIEKFGVSPEQMGDFLALVGDRGDNIPGVPGVGAVTAAKLLMQFDTLEGVLTHPDDIGGKIAEAIREHANAARLGRKVVALQTDVPLDFGHLFKERKAKKLADDGLEEFKGELEPKKDSLAKPDKARSAIATYAGSYEQGLEPATLDAAWQLATGMHNSRLYQKFPTPQACWAVIIRGRELGIGALTALDCFHVIEGKPALHAHLIIARAKAHPDCEFFRMVESTAERATYETKHKRNPEATRLTYTIEQAKKARVMRNGGPWETRPDEMLRKTCAVQLARIEYPDAALGLYAVEELEE